MMPVSIAAGQPAHLDPQNQTDVLHANFSDKAVKSASVFSRLTADPLVVVDDQDPGPWPSQRNGVVDQCVLTLARFTMIENLLRSRLADIDDRQKTELPI